MTDRIGVRVRDVVARVDAAARAAGRSPREVTPMLAVKTRTDAQIRAALEAMTAALAVRDGAESAGEGGGGPGAPHLLLGHNRVQEMAAGGPALDREANPSVPAHEMHLIGPLQSNKINQTLRWATSVDTVGDAAMATKLDAAVGRRLAAGDGVGLHGAEHLDVLIQVNTSGESTKSGAAPTDASELVRHVAALPHLRLRGFFTIGAHTSDRAVVRASFDALREVRDAALASDVPGTEEARELSMGMSADLELAITCGATTVRLGTAVFGPRPA